MKSIESERVYEQFKQSYHAGFSDEELKALKRREDERLKGGSDALLDLGLPSRLALPYYNLGIKTIEGLVEMLERDSQPRNIGEKSLLKVKAAIRSYENQGSR